MHRLQGGAGVASHGAGQGLGGAGRGCMRGMRETQEEGVVQVEHGEFAYGGGERRRGKGEVGLGWVFSGGGGGELEQADGEVTKGATCIDTATRRGWWRRSSA